MQLPYSRTVNVTVTRNSGFPSRRGFGVALFLTSTEVAGELDASNLTKTYGSIEEVAVDFATTDDFYKAATAAFSQNPRPLQVKAGFYDDADISAAAMTASIAAIIDVDSEWYWLCIETALRDVAGLDGLVSWVGTQNKQLIIDTNDVNTESVADTTSISARHKNTTDRTSTFYHTDAQYYGAFALAASLGTRVFDDADTAYTGKFKKLAGIQPVNIGSAKVQAVTGFTPNIGQAVTTGHMANTLINIGGQNFVAEGSTLTPNVFIDEVHVTDWIIARTEEEVLSILLNNDRVPYTDRGMQILASAPRKVMQIARNAGLIAEDLNDETGLYESSVEITIPKVLTTTENQRKSRIAPAIEIRFRYAGAVHYTTINYTITF